MIRFTQEPSSGSQSQCLAKITVLSCTVNYTHAQQVGICRHNNDNAHINKHSGNITVILARHWLWFPGDGSCMNRNMLEQILYFLCVFNNPAIYIIECISWTMKYLVLLMHGATTKIIVSQFTSNLNTPYWIAAKWVPEYLKKTSGYCLKLKQTGYMTQHHLLMTNEGRNQDDCKSHTLYDLVMADRFAAWVFKK